MKNFKITLALAAAVSAMIASLSSCSKLDGSDNYIYAPNAIVTVKTTSEGATYFQLDEKTTLEPAGWTNPYKREVRALLRYAEESEPSALFSKKVRVDRIDTIRTKNAVPYDDEFRKGADDGRWDLYGDWLTVCEDGYLSLHFVADWGQDRKLVHYINLGIDAEKHDLYLRHDRNGDDGYGVPAEGFIAFRIDELLPDVKDGDELTLHWTGYDGERTAKIKYLGRFALPQPEK